MNIDKILEILSYTIPSIVTGLVALYFFKYQMINDEKRRNYLLRKEKQNLAMPIRLQAYERLALFLERISPEKLLIRIKPSGNNSVNYLNKLIQNVEQEYEHNLAQQIYVTDTCWNAIVTSKNAISQMIRTAAANTEVNTAEELREKILKDSIENESPTQVALSLLKNEVKKVF